MPSANRTSDSTTAAANLIRFLETGSVPEKLFAPDIFADISIPHWRLHVNTAEDLLAVRKESHPFPGRVRVGRVETTDRGFTIEFEVRWEHDGQHWYCREMIRADVLGETIVEMSVYCTGDWDEAVQAQHAAEITLLRP